MFVLFFPLSLTKAKILVLSTQFIRILLTGLRSILQAITMFYASYSLFHNHLVISHCLHRFTVCLCILILTYFAIFISHGIITPTIYFQRSDSLEHAMQSLDSNHAFAHSILLSLPKASIFFLFFHDQPQVLSFAKFIMLAQQRLQS